jgi:hypothetical protein
MPEGVALHYAPDSPYAQASGFLNSLSHEQQEALEELQRFIINNSLNMSDIAYNFLHPSLVLLRYLRANQFDCARAQDHILRNIEWRREMTVSELCAMTPDAILGCEMKEFTTLFPHWHCGYDKQRRPVLYKQYGGFECSKLMQMTSLDAVTRYHVWEQEACLRLCLMQSLKSGYIVETMSAVIDVAGMQLRQVDSNFLSIVKAIAAVDQV